MRNLLLIVLSFFSNFVYAEVGWVSIGNGMFTHKNAEQYQTICINKNTYKYTKTQKKEGEFALNYTVSGLKPNKYGRYSEFVGYLGDCSKSSSSISVSSNSISDPNNSSIQNSIKEFFSKLKSDHYLEIPFFDSFRDKSTALKPVLNSNSWHINKGNKVTEECLTLEYHDGRVQSRIAMSYRLFLEDSSGKKMVLKERPLFIHLRCNCDIDAALSCDSINTITDANNNSLPEVTTVIHGPDGTCFTIDEVKDGKLDRVFNGTFYNGEC